MNIAPVARDIELEQNTHILRAARAIIYYTVLSKIPMLGFKGS